METVSLMLPKPTNQLNCNKVYLMAEMKNLVPVFNYVNYIREITSNM